MLDIGFATFLMLNKTMIYDSEYMINLLPKDLSHIIKLKI